MKKFGVACLLIAFAVLCRAQECPVRIHGAKAYASTMMFTPKTTFVTYSNDTDKLVRAVKFSAVHIDAVGDPVGVLQDVLIQRKLHPSQKTQAQFRVNYT